MKRVLIIGGSTLLGDRLAKCFMKKCDVWYTVNRKKVVIEGASQHIMDITNAESVNLGFADIRPEIAVLVAAYTEVDACESNKEIAWKMNVEGARNVVNACQRHSTKLVYISTDAIFDGTKTTPYTETDLPNPPNYYAYTKLEAEKLVLENIENIVCRVSTLYGKRSPHHRQNVIMWMIEQFQKRKHLELFEDRFCNPTFVDEAADVIATLALLDGRGTFHTTGRDCVSRVMLGRKIAEVFEYDESLIVPVKSREYQEVKRGLHTCLSVEKTERFIGRKIQTLETSLRILKDQLAENPCY